MVIGKIDRKYVDAVAKILTSFNDFPQLPTPIFISANLFAIPLKTRNQQFLAIQNAQFLLFSSNKKWLLLSSSLLIAVCNLGETPFRAAAIAQRFHLCLRSCGCGFASQAHNLCFFQFVLLKLYREEDKNKQKRGRDWPIF